MSGEFSVEHDALSLAANRHHDLAGRYANLQGRRGELKLPSGSLGKLPSSDEIQAAFDQRYEGLGEALTALREIYDNVGDALSLSRDAYVGSDEAVATMFTKLMSGGS
ncbi:MULTISPECIES: WXG100 family type VII secretion target [unclassified Actinotalea]|uniref:WXG100 family type VII secretion target n=1 Tax=unclassified Actinotalea TaxID=2638618 RepID=UPI0015F423E5|nr:MULTISPECIES: hypothetical protein [unclassified Actinotalea]